MIPAPRYTFPAGLKASGPGVETGEHSGALRPACDTGVFFTPAISPSMADRAWHPSTRWPAPESGFLPIHDLSPIFVEKDGDGSCPQTQEPVMTPAPSISPVIPNALINKSIASTIGNVRQVLFLLYALDVRDTGKKTISPDQAEVYRLIDESLDHVERKLRRERRPKSITQNQSAA